MLTPRISYVRMLFVQHGLCVYWMFNLEEHLDALYIDLKHTFPKYDIFESKLTADESIVVLFGRQS